MSEYKGEPLVLNVTAEDIPEGYTREHQAAGIYLWLCADFHNWEEDDKCKRCGEER